jgi:hypothetical protein
VTPSSAGGRKAQSSLFGSGRTSFGLGVLGGLAAPVAPAHPLSLAGAGGTPASAGPSTPPVPLFFRGGVGDTPVECAFQPLSRVPYFSQSQGNSQSQGALAALPMLVIDELSCGGGGRDEAPPASGAMVYSFPDSTPKENAAPTLLQQARPRAPVKNRKRRGAGDDDSQGGGHALAGWSGVRDAIPGSVPTQSRKRGFARRGVCVGGGLSVHERGEGRGGGALVRP